jgi:hypothetical protein
MHAGQPDMFGKVRHPLPVDMISFEHNCSEWPLLEKKICTSTTRYAKDDREALVASRLSYIESVYNQQQFSSTPSKPEPQQLPYVDEVIVYQPFAELIESPSERTDFKENADLLILSFIQTWADMTLEKFVSIHPHLILDDSEETPLPLDLNIFLAGYVFTCVPCRAAKSGASPHCLVGWGAAMWHRNTCYYTRRSLPVKKRSFIYSVDAKGSALARELIGAMGVHINDAYPRTLVKIGARFRCMNCEEGDNRVKKWFDWISLVRSFDLFVPPGDNHSVQDFTFARTTCGFETIVEIIAVQRCGTTKDMDEQFKEEYSFALFSRDTGCLWVVL